jgi:branched-chain amino acid aminotransferase
LNYLFFLPNPTSDSVPAKQYVWFDGRFVEFKDANVHILTHSLQYGSGIFEGIRTYDTDKGPAIFRLADHVKRFFNTAKIYGMELPIKPNALRQAITDTVKKNKLKECYIRPFGFYNSNQLGLNPMGRKVSVAIAAIAFGSYFANKDKGIKCRVSTWHRINSEILPPEAKGSGNYLNSILASIEAKKEGADEAILLSIDGYVSEGPGENIFFVQDGRLVTPSKSADILLGITRDSIMKLAEAKGIEVEERDMHREEIYTSDEAFFAGTAAEITPITTIDSRKIGKGRIGPITKMIDEAYVAAVHGENDEFSDWLSYVD